MEKTIACLCISSTKTQLQFNKKGKGETAVYSIDNYCDDELVEACIQKDFLGAQENFTKTTSGLLAMMNTEVTKDV